MGDRVTRAVLEAEVRGFIADMERAGHAASDVGRVVESSARQATRAQREQSTAAKQVAREQAEAARKGRAAFDETAQTAARGAIAVGAAIGLMGKAAVDWESSWAGVTKSVDGAGEQMEAQLRGLAKTLPATHDEIAAVAEAAGQLGVKSADVVGFTETMVKLGETTNLTADEAATTIAQISNVMGTMNRLGTDGIDRFANTLVRLGNNGASTERDIVAMASRISGAAKVVGMSEADLLAVSNALSSVGIEAEAGGTAVSNVLMDMSRAVKTGSDDLARFADVADMSAEDFARSFSTSPADAMDAFVQGLGRIQESGGDVFTVLDDLGQSDVRVSAALLKMAGAGDLLSTSLSQGRDEWQRNIAMQAEFDKRLQTTAARMQIARNNIRDAAITIGTSMTPALSAVADGVSNLAGLVAAIPEPLRNTGLAVAGVGSAGLLAAAGIGKVYEAGKTASEALTWISSRGPRAEKALHGVSRAGAAVGKVLGVAVVAGTIGGLLMNDSEWGGVDRLTSDLLASGDAIDVWDSKIGQASESIGIFRDDSVNSLDQALRVAFDPSRYDSFGKGIASVFNGISLGTLGLESTASQAADALKMVDQTLASIYAQNPGEAKNQFMAVAKAAAEQGISLDQLMSKLPQYEGAIAAAGNASKLAGDKAAGSAQGMSTLAGGVDEAAMSAEDAQKAIDDLVGALADLGSQLLGQRGSARDFQAAIDAATASVKENGRTLKIGTEAGRQNQAALDAIASATAEWASKSAEAGASQAEIADILRQGNSAFVDAADSMGMSRDAAESLAAELGLIPANVSTMYEATGADEATKKAGTFNRTVGDTPAWARTTFETPGADAAQAEAVDMTAKVDDVSEWVRTTFETPGSQEAKTEAFDVEKALRAIPDRTVAEIEANAGRALGAIAQVAGALTRLDGKSATTTVWTVYKSIGTPGAQGMSTRGGQVREDGGISEVVGGRVRHYDSGGIALGTGAYVPRVPQILSGTGGIVWQEPVTGWEAYISGKPGMERRNLRVWADAGARLGIPPWLIEMARANKSFANGGIAQAGGHVPSAPAAMGGPGMVRLHPEDRALLLAVADRPVQVEIEGKAVGRSVDTYRAGYGRR